MRIRKTLCCVLATLACLLAVTPAAYAAGCDHDYSLVAYQAPRHRAEGYERYRCTKCGDAYEVTLDRIPEAPVVWSYDSLSNAASDTLTIFVGYYGMSYQQKIQLPIRDIIDSCDMVTQSFSYINRRPRVCYAVGYGPLLRDVLEYAGVRTGSVQAVQFGTVDSGGNFYNQEEWTWSGLYRDRYFFPDLSVYYLADGTFSDSTAAWENAEWVEPMLAIWSSWKTYGIGEEFTLSDHSSDMSTDNCFRLLYGQSWIGESAANTSAKWCNAIYIRYTGSPSIDAGDDMRLSVEDSRDGYQLSASVRAADSQLTDLFSDAVRWSSSDESVVRVDAVTGKVTVVGVGAATITATAGFDGVTISDTLTVTVSAEGESTGTGGTGGTEGGSGTSPGFGEGTGPAPDPGGDPAPDPGTDPGTGGGTDPGTGGSVAPGEPPTDNGKPPAADPPSAADLPSAEDPPSAADPSAGSDAHLSLEPETAPAQAAPAADPVQPTQMTLQRVRITGGTGETSGGESSGGSGTEISLLLTSPLLLLLTALAALLLLALGAVWEYLYYRKQLK